MTYRVEEVVIGGEDRALIPAKIGSHKYKGLVDTGASRSCISERTYHNLDLPQSVELCEVQVSSATGTPIEVVGTVECRITLGNNHYLHNFIICRNIKRAMIIGLDFLKRFRIQTGWTEGGEFQIVSPMNETVEAIKVYHRCPTVRLKYPMTLAPRSLTIVKGTTTLGPKNKSKYCESTPNPHLMSEFPNLVMLPMLHHTNISGETDVPVCVINLGMDPIKVREARIVGLMKEEDMSGKEITTETNQETVFEVEDTYQSKPSGEWDSENETQHGGFIVSPADISTRNKPKLEDAEVTEEWKGQFEDLFKKYENIFSSSSADIGKTPLVQMDIDTGESPPISQRPYSLALKHVE